MLLKYSLLNMHAVKRYRIRNSLRHRRDTCAKNTAGHRAKQEKSGPYSDVHPGQIEPGIDDGIRIE